MTDPIKVALIASITPTIVALWNIKKSNEIHVLVNSNFTKVKEALAEAVKRVAQLEEIIKASNG